MCWISLILTWLHSSEPSKLLSSWSTDTDLPLSFQLANAISTYSTTSSQVHHRRRDSTHRRGFGTQPRCTESGFVALRWGTSTASTTTSPSAAGVGLGMGTDTIEGTGSINPFVKGLFLGKAIATQAHPKSEDTIIAAQQPVKPCVHPPLGARAL